MQVYLGETDSLSERSSLAGGSSVALERDTPVPYLHDQDALIAVLYCTVLYRAVLWRISRPSSSALRKRPLSNNYRQDACIATLRRLDICNR
jgi:hypothetical protein